MSKLLFSLSYRQTLNLLREEGIAEEQLVPAINLARTTTENWFFQEIEQGNLPLVIQLVKGKYSESSAQLLLEELKDLMVAKFEAQLGFNHPLARVAASAVLPSILKRMVEHLEHNPLFKNWWKNIDIRKHLPTKEEIKSKIRNVGQTFSGSSAADNSAFA